MIAVDARPRVIPELDKNIEKYVEALAEILSFYGNVPIQREMADAVALDGYQGKECNIISDNEPVGRALILVRELNVFGRLYLEGCASRPDYDSSGLVAALRRVTRDQGLSCQSIWISKSEGLAEEAKIQIYAAGTSLSDGFRFLSQKLGKVYEVYQKFRNGES